MSENKDSSIISETELRESEFQPVSRFVVLCLLSLNVYLFFWFYKHWRYLKDEKGYPISPGFRTLLIIFTGYTLFSDFNTLAKEYGYKQKVYSNLSFFCYTVLILTSQIEGFEFMILPAIFSFLLFIPALKMMNFVYLKEQVNFKLRATLGSDEIAFLVIFWSILLLAIYNR